MPGMVRVQSAFAQVPELCDRPGNHYISAGLTVGNLRDRHGKRHLRQDC